MSSLCEEGLVSTLQIPVCPAAWRVPLAQGLRNSPGAGDRGAKAGTNVPVATKPMNVALVLRHGQWPPDSAWMVP